MKRKHSTMIMVTAAAPEQIVISSGKRLVRGFRQVPVEEESRELVFDSSSVTSSTAFAEDDSDASLGGSDNNGDSSYKRVRFSEENNRVHVYRRSGEENDSVDETIRKRRLWYSKYDLIEMKKLAKVVAGRSRQDLEYTLSDAYMHYLEPVSDFRDQDELRDDYKHLRRLLSSPSFAEQRGMERYSSRRFAFSRGLSQIRVKKEVLVGRAPSDTTNHNPSKREGVDVSPASPAWLKARAPNDSGGEEGAGGDDCAKAQHRCRHRHSTGAMAARAADASAPAARFAQLIGAVDACIAAEQYRR